MSKLTSPDERKKLRIPNVDVHLDDVEVEIINTREFQRLFYLKQLGLAYLIYPGATHTRGVHSIETLYQAERILDALEKNKFGISQSECEAVRLAALLHDIGHVPFSHTLEDEHKVLDKPHDGAVRLDTILNSLKQSLASNVRDKLLLRKIEERLKSAREILISVASKEDNDKDWKSDLVGNTICADLLAYINADAAWTGIEKRPGHYRIYDYFRLVEKSYKKNVIKEGEIVEEEEKKKRLCIDLTKNGVLRVDIVSAILDILDIRYAITERVLFHHAKCVASAMLARAARFCSLDDQDCECVAEDRALTSSNPVRSLLRMGDETFLDFLERRASDNRVSEALHLVQGLRSRQLYKRVFKISRGMKDAHDAEMPPVDFIDKWRKPEEVERLLCGVEDEVPGLRRGDLVLWCSDAKSGMKLVGVNVTWQIQDRYEEPRPLRDVTEFPTVHKRVEAIEQQYRDLWCFWVAVNKRHASKVGAIIDAIERRVHLPCDQLFKEACLSRGGKETIEDISTSEVNKTVKTLMAQIELETYARLATLEAPAYSGEDDRIDPAVITSIVKDVTEHLTDEDSSEERASRSRKSPRRKSTRNRKALTNETASPLFSTDDERKPESE